MTIENKVCEKFSEALQDAEQPVPDSFEKDMILLESGLDSLGFAILVAQLESDLGYDPFTLMDEPIYPRTFGEFIAIYEKYQSHAK